MIKNILICLGLLSLSGTVHSAYSQNVEVKGIVIDEVSKTPLPGVMVKTLQNDKYTAMTGDDGTFTIMVPVHSTSLYIYSPEYLSQQVVINKKGMTVVKMLSDKFDKMYDNATSIVSSKTVTVRNTTSKSIDADIEDHLGADVRALSRSGAPGIGSNMFIRGINSLNANAQPLFVIDGVIQDMQVTRTALHLGDFNNLLLNLNPEEIENVTVLKNGTALYGAKGGNGVILIRTKRGHSMATRIDANISVGVEFIPKVPDVMDETQYRLYASELVGTYPNLNHKTVLNFLNDDPTNYYYHIYHGNNTDWSKEVYHNAITQNYNVNVQGGDDIGMYNLSLGYTDGESTAKENKFNRLNVRFNTDINIVKNLSTKFDMALTKVNRDVFDDGAPADFTQGTVTSPTFLAMIKSPMLSPYEWNAYTNTSSGTYSDADTFLSNFDENLSLANPLAIIADNHGSGINRNHVENTMLGIKLVPTYKFNDHLKLTENVCYTLNRSSQRYYRPVDGVPSFVVEGVGRVQKCAKSLSSKGEELSSDTRLNFSQQYDAHHLDVFGGFRYLYNKYNRVQPEGQNAPGGSDKNPNISSMDYYQVFGDDDVNKDLAWYAQGDYNYRNLYFAEISMSLDANSKFGKKSSGLNLFGTRWNFFPSVQLGWVMSNEGWFGNKGIVNYLRVNAGYDLSGNDDISNYAARTSYNLEKYLYSKGNSSIGAQLNNLGNEKITCEKTGKFNFGLESYLFDNRIGLNMDFYLNHTSDLLNLKSVETSLAGINSYWTNSGSLENKGFEITLTGKPVVSKNLNVELGVSMGHYKNKIKDLAENSQLYIDGVNTVQGFTSSIYGTDNIATIVGQSAGVFYGYKSAGVFSDDAEAKAAGKNGYLKTVDNTGTEQYFKAGDIHFVDLNGDGIIDDKDKTIIGNPNPDLYGNVFGRVNWKNFTVYVGFNYSLGNDVYNYERKILESESNFFNQTTAVVNRWYCEGQQTSIPRLAYGDPMGNSRFSDRWIEDGSYIRLKTLNVSYVLPMRAHTFIQGMTIWAEANNLFTITRYLGSDPEFSAASSSLYQGIDAGCISFGRTFTMGLKINL